MGGSAALYDLLLVLLVFPWVYCQSDLSFYFPDCSWLDLLDNMHWHDKILAIKHLFKKNYLKSTFPWDGHLQVDRSFSRAKSPTNILRLHAWKKKEFLIVKTTEIPQHLVWVGLAANPLWSNLSLAVTIVWTSPFAQVTSIMVTGQDHHHLLCNCIEVKWNQVNQYF